MVRLSTVLGFAFAATSVLIPGVLSQDIPACAQSCAQSAADSSGCSLADTNCICTSSAFASAGGLCIAQQCTPDEVQAAQNFFLSLCSGAGTSSSSPSSGTSTGTDTSTPTDTSTAINTSSVTPSSTTNTTPLTTATSSTPRTTTTSPSSTRTSSTSTTSSSSSSTPSNHATHDKPAGVLGAGLALGLALFAW
ncbi:hypothetical protein EDB92DRAFT_1882135 [Lactarius akahatsu]|uniref:CFEM domain-containing protein n=1 Tax=Lactarius akahatsu TaxID=416441 RepID=A0AAD4LFP2_9AGAM|nr:hypothetical protein EDB92DRAFT_1882135 [Lactarius akahatsu]